MRKINFDIKRKINNKKKKNMFEVKKSSRPINKKKKTNDKKLFEIMEKRFNIIIGIICILFLIITSRVFYLQILKNDEYTEKLSYSTEKKIESTSSPRGRIYDRNYNLLVDNQAIKTIYYKKQSGITQKEEIDLAYRIGEILNINYKNLSTYRLKNFYYINNLEACKNKITKDEWNKYKKRKLTDKDIEELIFKRITDEELSKYNSEKLTMIKHITEEISKNDHRIFYMLLQMEGYLENEEYDKLKSQLLGI